VIQIIKEMPLSGSGAEQVLVRRRNGDYAIVSSVVAPFSGFETLVFPADEHGEVTSWGEIAGGRGVSREDAIAELEAMDSEAVNAD
jgi:hypothetical protein